MTQDGEHHQGAKPGKATTANVNHSLRRLRHELEKDEIKSIALPRLATGVGGLEWAEVLPLIRTNLAVLEIPVYLYTHYQKGVQANEVRRLRIGSHRVSESRKHLRQAIKRPFFKAFLSSYTFRWS